MRSLKGHIAKTYLALRVGIAALGVALPLVLLIGGWATAQILPQGSMSAYYHACAEGITSCRAGVMRDYFVGILWAVGSGLALYSGYTVLEDWALNLAGFFLVCVALFPMPWPTSDKFTVSAHYVFAVAFFVCVAYVCMFRASDTLPLIRDRELRDRYGHLYRTFGLAMIGAPVIAMVLAAKDVRTFWVELAGVWVFAAYWITKSFEIRHTDSERRAVAGELVTAQHTVRDIFKSVDVLPQTPDAPR